MTLPLSQEVQFSYQGSRQCLPESSVELLNINETFGYSLVHMVEGSEPVYFTEWAE